MSSLPFGIIDICFVAILVISGILAYIRGFVREVLSVAAWVGATFVTLYGYPHLQPIAREHIENRMLADGAAGGLLFVGSLIIFSIVASVLSRSVRESAASGFDRSLGFAFGVLRGVILISLLYLSAAWFWDRDKLPSAVLEARTFPLIDGSAQILLSLVPNDARQSAEKATGIAKDATDRAINAERTLRGLMQPQPENKPVTEGGPGQSGYGKSERSEMQRLIESKQ
ncbi:MAG: CvpA family protein [Alphaproteobacteria bacterium]|nr:CvpA family protein [Alphaproteobacteria bacterium]